MKRIPYAAPLLAVLGLALLPVLTTTGCGSDSDEIAPGAGDGGDGSAEGNTGGDGGGGSFIDAIVDGSRGDAAECKATSQACATSAECCTANCAGGLCAVLTTPAGSCKLPNAACTAGNECCTGSCPGGLCSSKQCVADNGACGANTDCCGQTCAPDGKGGGTCKPLSATCRTSGNPCTEPGQCCSNLCNNGLCSGAVSFCTQKGEICSTNFECCTGNCVKTGTNAAGLCGDVLGGGAGGCSPSGTVCGTGAGTSVCEQACCSRSCGPFGATNGFRVCQPPSGCHPTGEVCRADSDCCGWSGSPDPKMGFVECDKPAGSEFGRCNNGNACREPGSICKVGGTDSCSAENNCCETLNQPSGNCNNKPENCCRQDALGIPRCLVAYVGDCSAPPPAGTVCATSADCCGAPCVNNVCGAQGSCIPSGGSCTTHADCCAGTPCIAAPGSTKGVCGGKVTPDGGVADAGTPPGGCALYGQSCAVPGDCCNSVPCTKAPGAATGNCRYP